MSARLFGACLHPLVTVTKVVTTASLIWVAVEVSTGASVVVGGVLNAVVEVEVEVELETGAGAFATAGATTLDTTAAAEETAETAEATGAAGELLPLALVAQRYKIESADSSQACVQ